MNNALNDLDVSGDVREAGAAVTTIVTLDYRDDVSVKLGHYLTKDVGLRVLRYSGRGMRRQKWPDSAGGLGEDGG